MKPSSIVKSSSSQELERSDLGVSELEDGEAQVVERQAGDRPAKVPLTARLLLRESLSARRAAAIIAASRF